MSHVSCDLQGLSQSKVQDLDLSLGSDLDVGGFQVPMDDPLLMGGLDTFGDLTADLQGLFYWQWPFGYFLSQSFTFHQLQAEKANTIRFFQFIDSCDVGMIQ